VCLRRSGAELLGALRVVGEGSEERTDVERATLGSAQGGDGSVERGVRGEVNGFANRVEQLGLVRQVFKEAAAVQV
jgi:hypothetical protein